MQTVAGQLSGEAIFNMPLVWLGFRPEIVGATLLFNLLYQFWLHTELVPKLGWLEWVFNTPSHHRVHHATNQDYLDRNFSGTLIVFDRLFGTERSDTPCRYGLVKRLTSYNPGYIALHEWLAMARDIRQVKTWRERWCYVFGLPGWSPAGITAVAGDGARALGSARSTIGAVVLIFARRQCRSCPNKMLRHSRPLVSQPAPHKSSSCPRLSRVSTS